MAVHCAECRDQFHPIEGQELPAGVEDPQFCSADCEDAWWSRVEASEVYDEAATGAPVFPS